MSRALPSHGENSGSSPLGSANNINGLISKFLRVSRLCPVKSSRNAPRLSTGTEPRWPMGSSWSFGGWVLEAREAARTASVRRVAVAAPCGSTNAATPFRGEQQCHQSAALGETQQPGQTAATFSCVRHASRWGAIIGFLIRDKLTYFPKVSKT
jgi:hypothetical protein